MIAWAWSVYPRLSSLPIVAAGITDRQGKARDDVEAVLGADQSAGWGVLQQVRIAPGDPCPEPQPPEVWPAPGITPMMCMRGAEDGFVWQPAQPALH